MRTWDLNLVRDRFVRHLIGPFIVASFALPAAGQARQPGVGAPGLLPDRSALVVFPARFSEGRPVETLSPDGFEVRLTSLKEPGDELVFPAGKPFQPPPGRYRLWLQGDWSMTPYTLMVAYSGKSGGDRRLRTRLPVAAAGRVTLSPRFDEETELELRLLHAGRYREGDVPRQELVRRWRVEAVGDDGLLMPEGPTFAALWDRRKDRYVAVSRPFEVQRRKIVEAPIMRPRGVAHVIAYVDRPSGRAPLDDVELTITQRDEKLPPALRVSTLDGLYAIWYDLAPGPAEFAGGSDDLQIEPRKILLVAGDIERLDVELAARPALDVLFDLPPMLWEEELALRLHRLPDGELLAEETLSGRIESHRFPNLSRGLLEVELETPVGSFRRRVDLTQGDDGMVVLDPEVYAISGTVRRGGEGHQADLVFYTVARDRIDAEANAEGAYRLLALQALRSVEVDLAGGEHAPYVDFFSPAIRGDRVLDFDLPDAETTVRVLDAVSRTAVPGAEVHVKNSFSTDEGETGEGFGKKRWARAVAQSVIADDRGLALLPPPRRGVLEIHASAVGYRPMREPLSVEVADPDADREVEILLEPVGETVRLRLTLPSGAPAAGAEVLRLASLHARSSLYSGRADAAGTVDVPRQPELGVLLLRHPEAAFGIEDWRALSAGEAREWTFATAAGRPLAIRTMDPSGEVPEPLVELAVWIDGRRLSGTALAWLTGARSMTDHHGFWLGTRIPPGEISVLAWARQRQEEAMASSLDTLAIEVPYPWPDGIEVRTVR